MKEQKKNPVTIKKKKKKTNMKLHEISVLNQYK